MRTPFGGMQDVRRPGAWAVLVLALFGLGTPAVGQSEQQDPRFGGSLDQVGDTRITLAVKDQPLQDVDRLAGQPDRPGGRPPRDSRSFGSTPGPSPAH